MKSWKTLHIAIEQDGSSDFFFSEWETEGKILQWKEMHYVILK